MDYSPLYQLSNGVLGSGGQLAMPSVSGSGLNPSWAGGSALPNMNYTGQGNSPSSAGNVYSSLGAAAPVLNAGSAASQLPNFNMTGQGGASAQSPFNFGQWPQLINLLMGKLGSSPGQGSIFGGGQSGMSLPSSLFGINSGMYSK